MPEQGETNGQRALFTISEAGDDNKKYIYRRQLNDRDYEVRLLELRESPGSGSTHAFQCRLQYLSLKDSPQYVALSYCWGDLPSTKDLVVENARIGVSETLMSALEQLWQMGHTLIWVGYLCINQDDNDEKSDQARMMDIIFSKAATVFAWLGTGDADSDMAMAVLGASRLSEQVEPPEETEVACDAVIRLFSRPYWTRCWVIQEICLAKAPVIVCGGRSVPWGTMLKRLGELGNSVPAQYAQHLISPLRQMRYQEENKLRAQTETGLIPLLVLSRRYLARDPRDKLYALLSLARDGRTLIPTPNYSQTVEQIFLDAARSMIEDHDMTDIILLAHRTRGVRNLPSWVPDWANMHSEPPPWVLKFLYQRNPGAIIRNKIRGNRLEAHGWQYDTIIDPLDSTEYNYRHRRIDDLYLYVAESVTDLFMGLTIGDETELDRHKITLVLLRMSIGHDSPVARRPSGLSNWVSNNLNRVFGSREVHAISSKGPSVDEQDLERTKLDLEQRFERLERLRMVFVSTRSGLFRVVHRDAKPGDNIYFLQNCPLPVVLRRQTFGNFGYVGEVLISQTFKDTKMNVPASDMGPVYIE